MGWYAEQVLPRIINIACAKGPGVGQLRDRVCSGVSGAVVEVGFGSGLNVPHYPRGVTAIAAVEPSDVAWGLAAERVAATSVPVRRAGLDAQARAFEDDIFDAALSTWTLCTVPDVGAALAELHRVLRPGGTFHFVEHGLAPDESVVRWQRRLEPAQRRLAGGCHLTRPILELVEGSGFAIEEVDAFYLDGAPTVLGALVLGVASA